MNSASRSAKPGSRAMRRPLVLIIRWRIGRALAAARISKNCGWIVGSPPESCTRSGSPSEATAAAHGRTGEADRAGQVAGVVDLDDRQAGVLLVVWAEAAVVGAAVFGAALQRHRPVAGLQPVALRFPIADVVGDQRLLHPVVAATFLEIDRAVLGQNLGRDQFQAGLTEAGGLAEEQIGRDLAGLQRRRARRRGLGGNSRRHRPPTPRTSGGRG